MIHEPGHQSQRSIPLKPKPAQPRPTAGLSSPSPMNGYPFPTPPAIAEPFPAQSTYAPPAQYAPSPSLRRPGCVTITALVFFMMASFSLLGVLGSLLLLDPLGLINNLGTMVIFGMTGLGLWAMYRWGANLTIMFMATSIVQFVVLYIYSIFLIDDYVTSSIGQGYLLFFCGGGLVFVSILLGVIWWWFARTRRWFLPNNLFPDYERGLYLFAMLIFGLGIVTSVVMLPDAFEQQRSEFEQFNRDIEAIEGSTSPRYEVTPNSPFGS